MQSTGTFTPDAIRYLYALPPIQDRADKGRFCIIVALEVAAYLYQASRAVLSKTAGDDGRGPWQRSEGDVSLEKVDVGNGDCRC